MNKLSQLSLEQYAAEYIQLWEVGQLTAWRLARICAAVETIRGEKSVVEFCKLLADSGIYLTPSYFYEHARTAKTFPDDKITLKYNLPYTFFRVAARTDNPEGWLGTAQDNNWAVWELEQAVAHEKQTLSPVPATPQFSSGGANENSLAVSTRSRLFVFEINVADENIQVFEKGLERLRTQYTAVEAFLRNMIMRKGRE